MRRHGSMMVVLSGLLAASLAIGLPVGSAYADEPTDGTGAGTSATEVLDSLEVKGRAPKTGYKRTQFGKAWADVDHNGCDTRNDILNRDLTGVRHKWRTHNCVVKSGKLHDPYTGKDIKFKKGKKTSTAVQIDHVVALSDAWQKGAQKLSEERRTALANDPYNLLAVQGRANQKKSDGDAATWLPSNKGFRCEYVARQDWCEAQIFAVDHAGRERGHIQGIVLLPDANRARLHGSQGFYSREDHRIRADRTDADRTADRTIS